MNQRYFTLEEAQAVLPQVKKQIINIQSLKNQLDDKIAHWHENNDIEEDKKGEVETTLEESQINFLVSQINEKIKVVSDMGCLPKDLEMGLVDFPARIDGVEGYLCWHLGETEIGYWHGMTEGYKGRKPIKPRLKTSP